MNQSLPGYHNFEEFINRSKKLDEIEKLGVVPYPHQYKPTHAISNICSEYNQKDIGDSQDAASGTIKVCVAGRLVLFRAMGKNSFAHIQDSTGRIQIMINRDLTILSGLDSSLSASKIIEKKIDLGDIIGVRGDLFHTHKGELTIYAKEITLLCKTLLPLPDKHSGLTDKETRYRKRWLDLISNSCVKETFIVRSKIIKLIRNYLENQGFVEVETPVLQNVYGGAAARPFKTNFNALDAQEMFLRISLEIPLKKLIVGGLDRVFEIGKVFRNEGIDKNHNPEFTELEAYASYWDYNDMMVFVENLFEMVAINIYGSTQVPYHYNGKDIIIDMKTPWIRLSVKESLKKFGNIEADCLSDDEMRDILKKDHHKEDGEIKNLTRGLLIFMLFEERVEHHLVQPHHIIDHPIETTPLCKLHRDQKESKQGIVERFESFIIGSEICNAYTELNDPNMQRQLLIEQSLKRESGDEEANPLDEEFIESICQGMPPTSGVGIGIDRLVMMFTNSQSIRDVLLFPFMKS